jgi:hypothetical protein
LASACPAQRLFYLPSTNIDIILNFFLVTLPCKKIFYVQLKYLTVS